MRSTSIKSLLFSLLLLPMVLFCQTNYEDTCHYRLFDVNGKEVKISSFKGKVVYMDFWASWCKGCKIYFDSAASLHKRFTPKQLKKIVFVYVSIDDDLTAWKKAVPKTGVKGIHLCSPRSDTNYLGQCFRVTGLPRFIIFKKNGEIGTFIALTPYQREVFDELIRYIQE